MIFCTISLFFFSNKLEKGYDYLDLYTGFEGGESLVAHLASYTGSILEYKEVGFHMYMLLCNGRSFKS